MLRKITSVCTVFFFAFQVIVANQLQAQTIFSSLNLPDAAGALSTSGSFTPVMIRGMQILPGEGLNFSFILDSGDKAFNEQNLQSESEKLIKYFLTSLTVPEDDLWVNLSPYESGRISSDALIKTEMGRDLLAQDYILKKITSSLMYPDDETGKKFWEKLYQKVYEVYGHTDIPLEAFHKIWIMPKTAEVFAEGNTVLILDSSMKVMLEEDYFAEEQGKQIQDATSIEMKSVLRDVVLPAIEEEVNRGENFANLRQIYHALILAKWFKTNLKQTLLGKVYADQKKTGGVESSEPGQIDQIYQRYLEAFKAGSEGYLKEDYDEHAQAVVAKKYVTGGYRGNVSINQAMMDRQDAVGRAESVMVGQPFRSPFALVPVDSLGRSNAAMLSIGSFFRGVLLIGFLMAFIQCAQDKVSKNNDQSRQPAGIEENDTQPAGGFEKKDGGNSGGVSPEILERIKNKAQGYGYNGAVQDYLAGTDKPWNKVDLKNKTPQQAVQLLAEAIKSVISYDQNRMNFMTATVSQTLSTNEMGNLMSELDYMVQNNGTVCNGFAAALAIIAQAHGYDVNVFAAKSNYQTDNWDHAINILDLGKGQVMILDLAQSQLVYSEPFSFSAYKKVKSSDGDFYDLQNLGAVKLTGDPSGKLLRLYRHIAKASASDYYRSAYEVMRAYDDFVANFQRAQDIHRQVIQQLNSNGKMSQDVKDKFKEAYQLYAKAVAIRNDVWKKNPLEMQDVRRQVPTIVKKFNDFEGASASAVKNMKDIKDFFNSHKIPMDFAMMSIGALVRSVVLFSFFLVFIQCAQDKSSKDGQRQSVGVENKANQPAVEGQKEDGGNDGKAPPEVLSKIKQIVEDNGYSSRVANYLADPGKPWNKINLNNLSEEDAVIKISESIKSFISYFDAKEGRRDVNAYRGIEDNGGIALEKMLQNNQATCYGFALTLAIVAQANGYDVRMYHVKTNPSDSDWNHAVNVHHLKNGKVRMLDVAQKYLLYTDIFSMNSIYDIEQENGDQFYRIKNVSSFAGIAGNIPANVRGNYQILGEAPLKEMNIIIDGFIKQFEGINQRYNAVGDKQYEFRGYLQQRKVDIRDQNVITLLKTIQRDAKSEIEVINKLNQMQDLERRTILRYVVQADQIFKKLQEYLAKLNYAVGESTINLNAINQARKKVGLDKAMINNGGIDLQMKGDDFQMNGRLDIELFDNAQLSIDPAKVNGFVPVNIRIVPLQNLSQVFDQRGNDPSEDKRFSGADTPINLQRS